MADDPWAVTSTAPASPDPWTPVSAAPDPWSVQSSRPLAATDNPTYVSETPKLTVGDLVRHPITTGQSLLDYASQRAGYSKWHGPTGFLSRMAGDIGYQSDYGPAALALRRQEEKANAPLPARGGLESTAGFLGDITGSLVDPTSYLAPEVKIGIAGRPIVSSILGHAAGGAATMGVLDPITQGGNIVRGQQDAYDPWQTVGSMGLNAFIAGGLHGAGAVGKAVGETGRAVNAAIPDFTPVPKAAAPAAVAPAAPLDTTVDGLWGRLVHQESGGSQEATSEKGARGVAQLMPDTAVQVANQIGRPELAAVALENSDRGRAANQYLGKIYLGEQLDRFDDPALALAAYNAGPGRVAEWVQRFGSPDVIGRGKFIDLIPFKETRDYVRKILGAHAPAEGELTPAEVAASRQALQSHYGDGGYLPPSALERAQAIASEAPEQPAAAPEPAPTPAETAGQVADELHQRAEAFPGDLENQAEKSGPTPKSDFPGDWEPVAHEPLPAPAAPPEPDITDRALDQMRSGKKMSLGEGPSLVDALIKEGGVRNQGGELANVLDGGDRRWKMLGRQNTGMTLEEAAHWAQSRGYIGERLPEDLGAHQGPIPYATADDLIEALQRERAGEKVYPQDRINHEGRMVQDHIADLEPFLAELGVDPATHTNAEIRAAMDRYFHEAGHPTSFLDEADHANAAGAKIAELERELREREAGRANEPMEAGGLWDETRRGEQELFDDGGSIFGLGKATPAREMSEAARRVAQRDAIMASTKSGPLRASRTAGAVATPAGPLPRVEATFAEMWRHLKEALDVPVRQGRLGMRGALGTYNRKSGVVRVSGVHDVAVEAHELAHALEFTKKYPTLLAEMAKASKLLKTFDYDQKALRRHEGFAEWVRWYVTNPTYAKAVAPNFYDAFERAIAKDDPRAAAALKAVQRQYEDFLAAPSLASAARSVVRGKQPGLIKSFLNIATSKNIGGGIGPAVDMLWKTAANETYRGVVDHLHPWKQAVQELLATAERNGQHVHLLAADDPYKLLRQVPAVYAAGHMDLIHGVHPYHSLEPEGASLAQALELALGKNYDMKPGGLADQFDAYLISRRVRHDYDRIGQPGGLSQPPDQYSRAYHEQIVRDAEARNPQWEQAAQMIHDWNNELWTKRYEAGFLTEDDYTHGIENNPDYVPLYRDLSDNDRVGGAHGMSTKSAGGARQRKGSTRAYMSPVQSMMQNAYELNALIARNDALRALDDLAQMIGPDAGRIAERLPATEMKALRVGVDEVLDGAAREIGVSKTDQMLVKQTVAAMFGEDASAKIYRAQDMNERGEPILYVWKDGERIPLRLPDGKWGQHMIEAFSGMTPAMHGLAMEIASMPGRLLRIGTTSHPSFFFPNTIRDQFTATLLTDIGYRPFLDQAMGIKHELTQDAVSRHYNVVGGEVGGMQSAAERDARLKADMRVLHSRGVQLRHFASWQAVARAVELSETGTRMGLFERGVKHFTKEGLEPYKAAKEAAFEARDYMDFDRHGGWMGMRTMLRLVPFMNASMQAVDKVIRVTGGFGSGPKVLGALFGRPPATREEQRAFDNATKLWIGATMLAIGSLAWRASQKANPEFDENSDYVRNTAWAFPLPGTNLYGIVPKPYEIGSLSNAFERAFEATTLHDPTAWGRLGDGLATQLMPNLDPTVLEVPFSLASNRDHFGAPIVQDSQTKIDPQFQYTDRTSQFGKAVGDATAHLPRDLFGVDWRQSPAKVDFIVKSILSSWGRDALNATNASGRAPITSSPADMFVLSRFVKDWTRGAKSTKEFYGLVSGTSGEWTEAVGSVQKLVNAGEVERAAQYIQEMEPQKKAYTILQTVMGGAEKDIHPMERAQKISSVIQGLAFNLQQGDPLMLTGEGTQPLRLTPEQRREAVDALHRMAVSEQRNALIATGVEGWENREPLAYDKYVAQLRAANPELPQLLSMRIAVTDPKLATAAQSYALWKEIGPKLADVPEPLLKQILEEKSMHGSAGLRRALEKPVPVQ